MPFFEVSDDKFNLLYTFIDELSNINCAFFN